MSRHRLVGFLSEQQPDFRPDFGFDSAVQQFRQMAAERENYRFRFRLLSRLRHTYHRHSVPILAVDDLQFWDAAGSRWEQLDLNRTYKRVISLQNWQYMSPSRTRTRHTPLKYANNRQ
ncbi:MAG: hypothetical protein COA78_28280 [Blastopirellula sp.]|nr:MAG: hypothetical protein COA78_28280 [Blastopirellula sp.]